MMKEKKQKSEKLHRVSEKKVKIVKELVKLIESKRNLVVASTFNLSSAQLQEIRKKLRKDAVVKYVKKSTALRAIEASKKENINEISKYVTESPALIITDKDAFEIASLLAENRYPARAKAGQTAKKEIVLEAGPTDLMPGPILTELGAAGIKVGIVQGKVTIKEKQVLVKEGEVINHAVSSVLMKLEIFPFTVELEILGAYDSEAKKVYHNIKIDKERTLAKLKEAFFTSYQFAVKLGYPTKGTIMQILVNAIREANSLNFYAQKHEVSGILENREFSGCLEAKLQSMTETQSVFNHTQKATEVK